MRFPLDLVFLDRAGRPVRVVLEVPPRRLVACSVAAAVLETRAGEGFQFLAAWTEALAWAPLRAREPLASGPSQPPPTSRRSRKVSADSASSSVTFSSSD
jgi:hypothetical protein